MTIHHDADALHRLIATAAARGLTLAATRVAGVSQSLAPREYGDLRSSLQPTEASASDLRSSVGSDLPYAVPQHERLDYHHVEGGPKYLERAVHQEAGNVQDIMGEQVRRVMEG